MGTQMLGQGLRPWTEPQDRDPSTLHRDPRTGPWLRSRDWDSSPALRTRMGKHWETGTPTCNRHQVPMASGRCPSPIPAETQHGSRRACAARNAPFPSLHGRVPAAQAPELPCLGPRCVQSRRGGTAVRSSPPALVSPGADAFTQHVLWCQGERKDRQLSGFSHLAN